MRLSCTPGRNDHPQEYHSDRDNDSSIIVTVITVVISIISSNSSNNSNTNDDRVNDSDDRNGKDARNDNKFQ